MGTLQHFTHLPHELKETSENTEFRCDGCETMGIGKRYQCKQCNFNLHFHCGHSRTSIRSFMHQEHQLNLTLIQRSRTVFSTKHACEVCQINVGGLFYYCQRCNFYVHPLCSQLPQYVHHTTDKKHVLELREQEQRDFCAVCRGECRCWYYNCGTSRVSVHIDCLMEMVVLSDSDFTVKKRLARVPWWVFALCIFCFGIVFTLLYKPRAIDDQCVGDLSDSSCRLSVTRS